MRAVGIGAMVDAQAMPVLHQFRASHYNDKVRWALAHKGIAHRRVSYLPGPHRVPIARMTGQTSTPVLEIDGQVVAGSARIIDLLEQRFPQKSLYPWARTALDQALAIQERFDREVGPATRTVAFTAFVDDLGYVARLFGHGEHPLKLAFYRASLPFVKPLIARANGLVDPDHVQRAFDATARALDWIAAETESKAMLVGDTFSIADLTAAALMAPVVALEHPDMQPRAPVPATLSALHARWEGHPGVAWVRRQYAVHRPLDATMT
jgi:glutathione S-transferase